MKKLEVYFDYACPYCYKGLQELSSLLKKYPDTKVEYIPCEAHPRPEPAPIHSDLAAQVGCYLQERDLDIAKYNDLVYHAHFVEKEELMTLHFCVNLLLFVVQMPLMSLLHSRKMSMPPKSLPTINEFGKPSPLTLCQAIALETKLRLLVADYLSIFIKSKS